MAFLVLAGWTGAAACGHVLRFSGLRRCPKCGGADSDPRVVGTRCHGFLSGDGRYARCTREDYAGGLLKASSGTYEQVRRYALLPQPGKAADPRAGAFVARHATLVQAELDALYQAAVDRFWDTSAYERALRSEAHERMALREAAS